MAKARRAIGECVLCLKFTGVSLVGFGTDAAVLHAGAGLGLSPAIARLVSLTCAMQVTFVLNGLHVFRRLERGRRLRRWCAYMLAGGFGNLCNYWIFVTLVSLHHPVASRPMVALAAGSAAGWIINYLGARLLVFGRARAALDALDALGGEPAPDEVRSAAWRRGGSPGP